MNETTQSPVYDAFGDRLVSSPRVPAVTKGARNVAVAIFWSVAVLLVAGRVYQHDVAPQFQSMELASR